jgi:hypothetical protein
MICTVIFRCTEIFYLPVYIYIYIEHVYCSSSGGAFCVYSNWYVTGVYIYIGRPNVSVKLRICSSIVRFTGIFWTPYIYIYIYRAGLLLIIRRYFLYIQQLVCVRRLHIQGDQKVSVNLKICSVNYICTETFQSSCIYIYIYIYGAPCWFLFRKYTTMHGPQSI